ncbi:MAG: hypothetical protein AAF620_15200 [Bacteroidota bacterium]
MTNKLQKALQRMKLRLDVVINPIAGKMGMAMSSAMLNGEETASNSLNEPSRA